MKTQIEALVNRIEEFMARQAATAKKAEDARNAAERRQVVVRLRRHRIKRDL